jgi:hypothetical protein
MKTSKVPSWAMMGLATLKTKGQWLVFQLGRLLHLDMPFNFKEKEKSK